MSMVTGLARYVARHFDPTAAQAGAMDFDGWVARLAQILDFGTELTQPVHQVGDRTFAHARGAVQLERSLAQGEGCGEWSQRGSREPQVQRFRSGAGDQGPGHTLNHMVAAIAGDANVELAQRLQHYVGVVALQQVDQPGAAVGHGRQQQRPIGDAF
jgi:hypothetical protein